MGINEDVYLLLINLIVLSEHFYEEYGHS